MRADDIETEVFLFPAAGHAEKEGAFTQTQRMVQWREKAVDPPGDARSEAWFIHQLALRLIERAKASDDPLDEPLRALDWWYPEDDLGDPDMKRSWRRSTVGRPLRQPTRRALSSVSIARAIHITARSWKDSPS